MNPQSDPRLVALRTMLAADLNFAASLEPKRSRYSPHVPTAAQSAFLRAHRAREILFGGAAGGGKSEALLMAALMHVDTPGYAAILFRRTLTDLWLPGALLDRSHQWLENSDARFDAADSTWRFPSGAKLSFGYLDREQHKYRYQGSEFQFIGFDELTQFTESQYTYLFSRLRRTKSLNVPLRMRAASNPGGVGHDWVRRRFLLEPGVDGRIFMPARIADNPHLDRNEYIRSLGALDPVTKAQLLEGDWNVSDDGLLGFEAIAACQAETLWPGGKPPTGSRPELYLGVDIGRTRDLTVIWTWEKIGDVCWCRDIACLHNVPFGRQKEIILGKLTRNVVKCAIDSGGIGSQMAEELKSLRSSQVECVRLSPGVQGRLAQRLAVAFNERSVRIPDDADLRSDLRLVRKTRVVGGVNQVQTLRNETGHADRFWSAALAYDAALSFAPTTASLPQAKLPSIHRFP